MIDDGVGAVGLQFRAIAHAPRDADGSQVCIGRQLHVDIAVADVPAPYGLASGSDV